MTDWTYRIVDVFTDRPLVGNQLAVFSAAATIPGTLLQPLAREIGFAETVFLYPAAAGGDARMRIFTPTSEIPFAGHPTLGTAILVARDRGKDEVVLETGQGPVPVVIERAPGRPDRGSMRQPLPIIADYPQPAGLLSALGVDESQLPITLYDNGIPHVYMALETPEQVSALEPNLAALARLSRQEGLQFVGANVFAGSGTRWKTRMFAPADGVPEDAATGSAAGPLALHLCRYGLVPWGAEIRISQGAEISRPSELLARAIGSDDRVEAIEVGGYAVPVGGGWFDGNLLRTAYGV
jgi:trans-2,3-dihydro-3-hydroxyanthranilate isomerase